jgi:DNA-binding transcriptional ArsR family regulator
VNTELFSELFGGADRYRALRCLFENPGRTFGARELAAQAQIDPGNASRWLRRWADAGLLEKTYVLKYPRYRPADDPTLKPLHQLFQQESEVIRQLRERISKLGNRVEAAAVFGSTAKAPRRLTATLICCCLRTCHAWKPRLSSNRSAESWGDRSVC